MRIVICFVLGMLAACTTISFQPPRALFGPDEPVSAKCESYEDVKALSDAVAAEARGGWRVMQTGIATTTFILSSSTAIVCYEQVRRAKSDAQAPRPPAAHVSEPEEPRPAQPAPEAVTEALVGVLPAATACLTADDAASRARVTFGSAGSVTSVVVTGGAVGKPAEDCIRKALLPATVPPFTQDSFGATVNVRPK